MKKLITLSLLGVLTLSAAAQTQKGQSITSGEIYLNFLRGSFNEQDRIVTYSAGILINRGRFYKDNWFFGYTAGLSYTHFGVDDYQSVTRVAGHSLNGYAGLSLRRYWYLADRLYVYVGGSLFGFRQETRAETAASPLLVNWQVTPAGQAGALYVLSRRIAVEASVSNNFPTELSSVGIGIAVLTGNVDAGTLNPADVETPQIKKGRWLLGASASVKGARNMSNDNGLPTSAATSSAAATGLSAGYFLRDGLVAGVTATYSALRNGNDTAPGAVNYSWSAGLFARTYLGTHRLRPFLEGKLEYGLSKEASSVRRLQYISGNISAGLAYMAGDRFIIQTTIGTLDNRYRWVSDDGFGQHYTEYTADARVTTRANISVAYSL